MIQKKEELEKWYEKDDPWGYEDHPEDKKRKSILLSEIPGRSYDRVLDIGCGQGFITRDLPGKHKTGVDISDQAIEKASSKGYADCTFYQSDLFNILDVVKGKFDLVIITGVLYPQYIGKAHTLVYSIIDSVLDQNGILASVHINEWYNAKFPYILLNEYCYDFKQFTHRIEIYLK